MRSADALLRSAWIFLLLQVQKARADGHCFGEKNFYVLRAGYVQCQEIHPITCTGITKPRIDLPLKLKEEKPIARRNPRECVHFTVINSNIPVIDDKTFSVDFYNSIVQLKLSNDQIRSIADNSFRKFPNLKKLFIFKNSLTSVNFISDLDELQEVILSNNSINVVRYEDFGRLKLLYKIDLSFNSLERIGNSTFNLIGLKELDLSYNRINKLELAAFFELKRLVVLKLNSNKLEKISNATFNTLERLEELYLNDNFLDNLENSTFGNLRNLRLLQLNNNRIKIVTKGAFNGLNNLRNLYLKNNQIKVIKPDSFLDLNKLSFLEIRGNEINTITNLTFQGLNNLVFINLTNLNIKSIESGGFDGLNSLKVLDLGNNRIETLMSGSLSNLINLKELYLINNTIRVIESNVFTDLKNLEVLNIEGNDITVLETDMFNGLSSLTTLAISDLNIKKIKSGAFNGLNNLNVLFLGSRDSSNEIELKNGTFQGLTSLEMLNLHNFNIIKIEVGAFGGLSTLQKLNLVNCGVSELNSGIFDDLNCNIWYIKSHSNEDKFPTYLRGYWYDFGNLSIRNIEDESLNGLFKKSDPYRRDNIYLNYNNINLLRNNTFAEISNLVELALDHNNLVTIESGAFNGLKFHVHPCYSTLKLINRKLTEIYICNTLYLNNNKLKILRDYTFDNLRNLVTLRLDHNLIEDIEANTFGDLSFNLESTPVILNTILLNNNKLKIIRKDLFSKIRNLVTLRLDDNEIEEIQAEAFNGFYFNPKTCIANDNNYYNALCLNNNKLKILTNNTFKGIKFIVSLYLNNNNISTIESGAFNNLLFSTNLCNSNISKTLNNILDLNNNKLTIISKNTFIGIQNLTKLRLDNNKISTIEYDAFSGLNNLLILYLNNNQINNLVENVFYNLNKLEILNLSDNQLFTLNSETFHGLNNLKQLLVYDNNIIEIFVGAFKYFPLLENLQMSNNNLSIFKTGVFTNLEDLKYLNLSNNNFNFINETVFYPLHNLQVLDLDDNRFTYIDFNLLLFHLPKLQFISINNNNWNCPLLTHMIKEFRARQINYLFNASLNYTEENVDGITCVEINDDDTSGSNSDEDNYKTVIKETIDELKLHQNNSNLNMMSVLNDINKKFDNLPFQDVDEKFDDWATQFTKVLENMQRNNSDDLEEKSIKLLKSKYKAEIDKTFNFSPYLAVIILLLCLSTVTICTVITVKICSTYFRRMKTGYNKAASLMELIDTAT
ncbi:hypothetical protein ILUMI_04238 [Ignelater luminosus]|uniref:Uncharacterized protein n=1 Tax=Ignelater luminosus TaxID=2038154 RepID=A0A8K0DA24_IGNLU|nr:hypothetical protein ILUMI_04238 [Ignelater luminosus]